MPQNQFAQLFGNEHREIRDALLDLIEAFRSRDMATIRESMEHVSTLVGPHFRFKEESLYRSLVDILGSDYIQHRLEAHDRVIGNTRRLMEMSRRTWLTEEEVTYAVHLIREILPHISDSAGLSLMVERLPEQRVRSILSARSECQAAGVDLFDWSTQMRQRPSIAPMSSQDMCTSLEMRCTD